MDKKRGRPKTGTAKLEQYRLRMNAEELQMLDWCCQQTSKTKADVLRIGLRSVYESLQKKE